MPGPARSSVPVVSDAHTGVFDHSEWFYNPTRRHRSSNEISPLQFEKQYFRRRENDDFALFEGGGVGRGLF